MYILYNIIFRIFYRHHYNILLLSIIDAYYTLLGILLLRRENLYSAFSHGISRIYIIYTDRGPCDKMQIYLCVRAGIIYAVIYTL